MITVKLWGGMCNQMFQYAFGYVLAKKNNDKLRFDVDFYDNQPSHVGKRKLINQEQFPALDNLSIVNRPFIIRLFEHKYVNHLIRYNFGCNIRIGKHNIVIERLHKHYSLVPYKKGIDNFYDGYWQSAEYFKDEEDEIRRLFTPSDEILNQIKHWRKNINSDCCIAVHIRRGDYLNSINKGKKNTIDNNSYYLQAIDIMQKKFDNPIFCFFSDDINWCRETFGDMLPTAVFVNNNCSDPALFDIYAIANCDHGIMSASTFSWWGNWLRNPNKQSVVIYPESNYAEKLISNNDWIQLSL